MSTFFVRTVVIVVVSSLAVTQTGCVTLSALMGNPKRPTLDTSLLEAQGYHIPPGGMPSMVKADASAGPRVVLEVRGDGRHLETIPLPTDHATFIEDLVQQGGLHEQIGNLSIAIMRPNGEGKPPIRLNCKTDSKGKAAHEGQNYALLPGDHIIVYSDGRSLLEKFIDTQFKQ